jgi:hypothetical protein
MLGLLKRMDTFDVPESETLPREPEEVSNASISAFVDRLYAALVSPAIPLNGDSEALLGNLVVSGGTPPGELRC